MEDPYQTGYWLALTGLLLIILLFTKTRFFPRRAVEEHLSQFGAWAVDRLTPGPEVDPLAEDLARVLRMERLRRDLQRLEGIIATDMSMSATRQLGNRLAYDWLLRELAEMRDVSPMVQAADSMNTWSVSTRPIQPTAPASSQHSQHRPKVEILDIGWRG
ncbi:MAG: hypothetical protein AVDCRST_MAG75-1369 [uncultured Propionibacteriaceae bacterium]|uniref:Uncharacterized protein n=1 Tax=uncultured Propionibacteriaceae bacterium TaxID=257457 RepID=A0A6J4NNI7_9ACTN|nr:MAG: hypothetical protein AVDCRST_MAG75-1369 [uncultured Propionibacteriaceae bacterium]